MRTSTALLILTAVSSIQSCLLDSDFHPKRHAALIRHSKARQRRQFSSHPIGTGDRFANGTTAPVGLGFEERSIESILSVDEISSATRALANAFPSQVSLFIAPFRTVEDRTQLGAVIKGKGGAEPRVFIQAGIHARERGGPDHLIYFVADLLAAKQANAGLSYGSKNYTALDVEAALSAGLVFLPLVNPDGVAHDQTHDDCWRKNRNATSAKEGDDLSVGVDLNRNFDFLWDYKKAFAREVNDQTYGAPASDDPSSDIFHGLAPASEAEVRNVVWVMDQHPGLSWFLDIHSFGGDILYAWGDDDVGTQDPGQTFANGDFDGMRGETDPDPPESQYKEYMEVSDLALEEAVSGSMAGSMNQAGSVSYEGVRAVKLYPTSGGSNDYALGRYYGHECGKGKISGIAIEFGERSDADWRCPFYPSEGEFHESMRQVGAGLMELMLNAAGPAGEPVYWEC